MATTTNFALNKPTVGGDENTWGGLTNDNWDDVDNLLRIAMPAGGIIMWSGSVASIPTGWLLCDGTSGTPDLTGRFVVHADADSGGTYDVGDTGGADSVTLAEANLPSHTHSFSATTGAAGAHTHAAVADAAGAHTHNIPVYGGSNGSFVSGETADVFFGNRATDSAGTHVHTVSMTPAIDHTHTVSGTTEATGSGTAFDNRPAFYALAYIMKA